MIQAVGLTSEARRGLPPAVDDLTFEAPAGKVTALLGTRGAGKTTALRLMLRMERGRGIALFRGHPLHRLPNPAREVGVLLGDVPGHPARTARSHLRMLTAAAGVPPERAEDVLEVVGLSGLADQRLGDFSRGMDRRLGMAAALLGDPHTLLLDEPSDGVSPREAAWLYGLLRGFAAQGGSVLVTASDAKAAARLADRIVTIEDGRLVADQDAEDFAHTRLRPRVSVQSPHADRLAAILIDEWQRADPAVDPRAEQALEVVRESGNRIAVYGSSCALVGDTAFRHGILVHQLADEVGDARPVIPLNRADGRPSARLTAGHAAVVPAEAGKEEGEYEKSDARYAGTVGEGGAYEPYPDEYDHEYGYGYDQAENANVQRDVPSIENAQRVGNAESVEVYAEAQSNVGEPADAVGARAHVEPSAGTDVDTDTNINTDTGAEAETEPWKAKRERRHAGELVRKDAGGHCALISDSTATEGAARVGGLQGEYRGVTASGRVLSVAERGSELTTTLELPVVSADDSIGTSPAKPTARPSRKLNGRRPGDAADGPPTAPADEQTASPTGPPPHDTSPHDTSLQDTPPHGTAVPLASPRAPRPSASTRNKVQATRLLLPRLPAPGPAWPVRYEVRRAASDRTAMGVGLLVLVVSLALAWVLARGGDVSAARALAGWPDRLPFPPAAVGAGLIGALAFGQEFRYPALAPEQGSVPRRLRLLGAKLLVSGVIALVLAGLTASLDGLTVGYVFGVQALPAVADWPLLTLGWGALLVGSAWAGLLAAGIFRSTAMGLACVLAVPVAVVPLLQGLLSDPTTRSMVGFPARVQTTAAVRWPSGVEELTDAAWRLAAQPVVGAMALSLAALLCAYALTALRGSGR